MTDHGAYGIWKLKRRSCIRRATAWVCMTLPSIKMALWLALGKASSTQPGQLSRLTSDICLLPQRTGFRILTQELFHQGTGCIWSSLGPAHRTLYHVPRRSPEGNIWNKFLPQWVNKLTDWGVGRVIGQRVLCFWPHHSIWSTATTLQLAVVTTRAKCGTFDSDAVSIPSLPIRT